MSYTRTETVANEEIEPVEKTLKLRTLFHTKTKPGTPWPTPPDHTITTTDDGDNDCCFPFRHRKLNK